MYETLYYAAMLRLPRHMSEAAKKERVFTVIRALGLDSCKDTIVGEAGFETGFPVMPALGWLAVTCASGGQCCQLAAEVWCER